MSKVTPFLWFDTQAEEAAKFYVSIFKNAKVIDVSRYGQGGAVMSATFELDGQLFMALNGGPQFKFTEAVSFYVHCETQAEVDFYWGKLCDGGEEGRRCDCVIGVRRRFSASPQRSPRETRAHRFRPGIPRWMPGSSTPAR